MVGLICRLFGLLSPLVRAAGADHEQFRAILQAKLTLDNRRHSVAFSTRRAKPRNTFMVSLMTHALLGLLMIAVIVRASSAFTALTVIQSFVMVMVGMSLISDFTAVLMDTTDLGVLGPRPVSGRTILVARLAHISTYLGLLALALSAGTLVAGSIVYHYLFALVFAGTLICSITLVVLFVNLFYLVALRFTDGERFKDVIVYFQVLMTVVIVGGYQILPRLMDFKTVAEIEVDGQWWNFVYPPCWFAAPGELLAGPGNPQLWTLTAMALVLPAVGLLIVVRRLAPGFTRSLLMLGSDVSAGGTDVRGGPGRLRGLIGRYVAGSGEQRVGFDLVWSMISRDRGFKQRVYPQIAFAFLWPVVLLLTREQGPASVIADLDQPKYYLMPLYFALFFLPMMVLQLSYSTQFEAAWIYYALPLEHPGELMVGALKALACRLALPVFGVLGGALVVLGGGRLLPDVVLVVCLAGVFFVVCAMVVGRELPFSANVSALQASGRIGLGFVLLIPPGMAGLGHYFLTFVPYGVTIAILPTAALCAVLLRVYARRGWPRSGLRFETQ